MKSQRRFSDPHSPLPKPAPWLQWLRGNTNLVFTLACIAAGLVILSVAFSKFEMPKQLPPPPPAAPLAAAINFRGGIDTTELRIQNTDIIPAEPSRISLKVGRDFYHLQTGGFKPGETRLFKLHDFTDASRRRYQPLLYKAENVLISIEGRHPSGFVVP